MKRIVIIGASGLVGSHLLPLLAADHEVHTISRSQHVEVAGQIVHHRLDFASDFDTSALPASVDGVVFLAQSEDFREFPEKARAVFDVNVAALVKMLDYARRAGASHFVSASSGGIYGAPEALASEDILIPASGHLGFYLSTKLCGEILAENYAPFMNVAILRFFFIYGRGQKRSMLIPRLIDAVRRGDPVTIDGEDGLRINPIHAADAAAACMAALALDGLHRINVAGPESLSLRQIAETIGETVRRAPVFEHREGQGGGSLVADIGKMEALLGLPRRRVADYLAEML